MNYHLDSSTAIALIRGKLRQVRRIFDQLNERGADFAISTVVLFELQYGVVKSSRPAHSEEGLNAFLLSNIEVLPFETADTRMAAELRLKMRPQPIGPYDLLIAAQAIRAGATLVTGNVGEFSRTGVRWEDWTVDPPLVGSP